MYVALLDVGSYKKGDVVPDDKAKVWLQMFRVPHVKMIEEQPSDEFPVASAEVLEEQPELAKPEEKHHKRRK